MNHALNAVLIRTVFAAALGGSLLGFDTAVISGAIQSLTSQFELSPAALGFTVSAALWGTVFGAIGAGVLGRASAAGPVCCSSLSATWFLRWAARGPTIGSPC